MHWGFFAATAVLAGLGGACLYFRQSFNREIALLAATQTSRAADVSRLAPGTLVEVKGTIRCDNPFNGQFSERPCVYSQSKILREEKRRQDGKIETHTTTESDIENRVAFDVEDASGRVRVDSKGASVTAPVVYDQNANTTVGDVAAIASDLLGGPSTRYRHIERILAPDTPLYVLGTVQADRSIGPASANAKVHDFIVTHETEEERTSSSKTSMIILTVLAVLLFAGALVTLYYTFKASGVSGS